MGSYEADDFKNISHYALIRLAKFYGVTADYLLEPTRTAQNQNRKKAICHRGVIENSKYTFGEKDIRDIWVDKYKKKENENGYSKVYRV